MKMSMYHGGAQIDKQKSAGHHRSNDTFSAPVTYTHYREPVETESYGKARPNTASRRKLTQEARGDPESPEQAMDEDDIVRRPIQPRRREGQTRPKSRLGRQRPKDTQSHDNYHMSHDISQSTDRHPSLEIEGICRSSFDDPSEDLLKDMQRPRTSRGDRLLSDLRSPEIMTPVTPNDEYHRPQTGYRRDSASNLVYRRTPSAMSSPSLTPSPPPPPPPSHARPKSSMGRQRRRPSSRDAVAIARSTSVLSEFSPPPRPMSRYAVLPSIGTKINLETTESSPSPYPTTRSPVMTQPRAESVLHRVDSLKLTREYTSSDLETGTEDEIPLDTKFKKLTRPVDVPAEPSAADKDSIILAVKLPHNGKRVKRRFRRSDTLANLLHFAESIADLDFDGFQLVCDVEKKTFTDLGETIASAGLPDRTLLHIQPPEMF